MSRQDPESRQKNENFLINLKRKLCLELWSNKETVICAYGQQMDACGDHACCCEVITKTTISDEIRDGIIRLLQHLLIAVWIITTAAVAKKEFVSLLKLAPTIRTFNLSVKLYHTLGDSIWQTTLNGLGFDVTVISSNASSVPIVRKLPTKKVWHIYKLVEGEVQLGWSYR